MSDVINLTYASKISDFCKINSSFDKAVLRICYAGKNRNNSYLSKQTIERCIPTLYNCPVVCNYDRDSDTLGGHDIEVIPSTDGTPRIVNVTTPVGVIPESANIWFEDVEEEDGSSHEYLCADVLLWKRQEAYQKIKEDGIVAHSMEITVKEGKSLDGIYHIDDFEFNAFALIGVEPCFESSRLEVYNFKQQMSEMMQDLKGIKLASSLKRDGNFISNNIQAKGGSAKLGNIDNNKNNEDVNSNESNYSLVSGLVDELMREIAKDKIPREWGEDYHYAYVDCDVEHNEVFCFDTMDWLLYGFSYSAEGDSVTVDFNSKKRKKFTIVDFEEGTKDSTNISSILTEFEAKLSKSVKDNAEIQDKFVKVTENVDSMKDELEKLRRFKRDTEDAVMKKELEAVFSKFEDLNGIEAFEGLKQNFADYDAETLEEKCFAIRGRNASVQKFSSKGNSPKLKINKSEPIEEPYGGLFVKYARN